MILIERMGKYKRSRQRRKNIFKMSFEDRENIVGSASTVKRKISALDQFILPMTSIY